ncbi:MAG: ribonuclease E/G [Pseudomonadota bacterium]
MKGRVLVLSRIRGRAAAALVSNGLLEDLLIDAAAGDTRPATGEIRLARLIRQGGGKTAGAFLDIGDGENGFLRDARGVKAGGSLIVQVASQPEPGKAVPVSTRVLYRGRLLIHTPGAPGVNVSRQIHDAAERQALKDAVEAAAEPFLAAHRTGDPGDDSPAATRHRLMAAQGAMLDDGGLIIRSAAEGAPDDALADALENVLAERGRVEAAAGAVDAPGARLLSRTAHETALCDWCSPMPDAIIADARTSGALTEAPHAMVDRAVLNRLERADDDPFDRLGIHDLIAAAMEPRMALPGGGSVVIEPTAALVAVDVNTGGDFGADAGVRANVEAARMLPRLLRIKGLGGQIVVDFAPMAKKDRRRLEDSLRAALKRDGIETVAHGFTTMGLFELQRKRERRPINLD